MTSAGGWLVDLIETAGEAQLRMQVEHGLERMEGYLASHAAFGTWCRENSRPAQGGQMPAESFGVPETEKGS